MYVLVSGDNGVILIIVFSLSFCIVMLFVVKCYYCLWDKLMVLVVGLFGVGLYSVCFKVLYWFLENSLGLNVDFFFLNCGVWDWEVFFR